MDNQQLFNLVVSVAGFLAVYTLNGLTKKIQSLEQQINPTVVAPPFPWSA